MMSSIFYGKIKEEKLASWTENKNPYDILESNNRVEKLGGWEFLSYSKTLFSDEVQVDWGSFAYKCTKKQLQELVDITHCEIEFSLLEEDKNLGIVFIEES